MATERTSPVELAADRVAQLLGEIIEGDYGLPEALKAKALAALADLHAAETAAGS